MNALRNLFLLVFITVIQGSCNSQGTTGVYAGVTTSVGMMNGGMSRTDVTLYLRPDGSFTDNLDEADWKTRVDGKYKTSGDELELTYTKNNRKKTYRINKNGTLSTTAGQILIKMDDKTISPGTYKFTYASGGGGMGTGTAYIGAMGGQNIFFDGKGNFSQDGYGGVVVSGEGIGGGTTRKDEVTTGTYTLKDGLLTFKYPDGKTESHSFFISADEKSVMAVMNGKIFFRKSELDMTGGKNREAGEKEEAASGKPDLAPAELVAKIREAHGAKAIDQVKTTKLSATANGLDLVSYNDYGRQWTRTEVFRNGKLLAVEQLEGDKGWSWTEGKKAVLDPERVKQMKASYNAGLGLLQSPRVSLLEKGKIEMTRTGYKIRYSAEGVDHVLTTNNKFVVIHEQKTINSTTSEIRFSDFREVSGMRMAFTEKQSDGKNSATVRITGFAVNNVNADAWKEI